MRTLLTKRDGLQQMPFQSVMTTNNSVRIIKVNKGGGYDSLCLQYDRPVYNPKKPATVFERERLPYTVYRKPGNDRERAYNKTMSDLAEEARKKRQDCLEKGLLISAGGEQDLLQFYRICSMGVKYNMTASWKALCRFCGGRCPFSEMSLDFCKEYRDYLLDRTRSGISKGTAMVYFSQFHKVLKQAYQTGRLHYDFSDKISAIQVPYDNPDFITDEEFSALLRSPCVNGEVSAMAFLSALCGLRYGEMQRMKWTDIHYDKERTWAEINRSGSGMPMSVNLSEEALALLPSRCSSEYVFNRCCHKEMTKNLKSWLLSAGISRQITFETFRHRTLESLEPYAVK